MTSVTGGLVITVVDAKDLISNQYGKADPYCKLNFPGFIFKQQYQTKAHKRGGSSPIWEESHTFRLSGTKPDAKLSISLYDKAVFKKKPIGCATICLSDLLEHRGENHYYEVIEEASENRVAGYVGIIVNFFDNGSKASFSEAEAKFPSFGSLRQSQPSTPQSSTRSLVDVPKTDTQPDTQPQSLTDSGRPVLKYRGSVTKFSDSALWQYCD